MFLVKIWNNDKLWVGIGKIIALLSLAGFLFGIIYKIAAPEDRPVLLTSVYLSEFEYPANPERKLSKYLDALPMYEGYSIFEIKNVSGIQAENVVIDLPFANGVTQIYQEGSKVETLYFNEAIKLGIIRPNKSIIVKTGAVKIIRSAPFTPFLRSRVALSTTLKDRARRTVDALRDTPITVLARRFFFIASPRDPPIRPRPIIVTRLNSFISAFSLQPSAFSADS